MSDLGFVLACLRFAWLYLTRDPIYLANAPQRVTDTALAVSAIVLVVVVGIVGAVVLFVLETRDRDRRARSFDASAT